MRTLSLTASAALAAAAIALTATPGQAAASSGATTAACAAGGTELTVRTVSRPINHDLLTVTNTGRTACNAYAFPYLRFDEDQAVTRAVEDSRPQAVVTLAPGESAYAGIGLSAGDGSAGHGRTARKLEVFLPDAEGATDTSATLTLPEGTWIDDSAAVTYWQSNPADALVW
ncbi:DUF4232 domain-containing protein [Streptomyces sp. NPDC001407]|uniref:DUF4232 domain-containing protein n=1 Tax=unclassified Streptomyces TaxID=2593676 RepID=UPI003400F2C4